MPGDVRGLCRLSEKIGRGGGFSKLGWDRFKELHGCSCEMFAMVFSYNDQFRLFVILYLHRRCHCISCSAFHIIPQLPYT